MALVRFETEGIADLTGCTILFVEGDNGITRLKIFDLEQAGYRVTCVGIGKNSKVLHNNPPTLFILGAITLEVDVFTNSLKIRESPRLPITITNDKQEAKHSLIRPGPPLQRPSRAI